ncbi:MAG: hypothetical protein ACLR0N_19465 [Bilophila wadsworthia]
MRRIQPWANRSLSVDAQYAQRKSGWQLLHHGEARHDAADRARTAPEHDGKGISGEDHGVIPVTGQ